MSRTREQDRIYQRERRAAMKGALPGDDPGNVTNIRSSRRREFGGGVVKALHAELAGIPGAGSHKELAETALRLAEVLDDPTATPQKAAAAGKLLEIMTMLRGVEPSAGGKLAQLRKNTLGG